MDFLPALLSPLDQAKPSLFELLSEQQLSALIPPSLRYLLAIATHRHPRYLLRILNNFDEVYALLTVLVEKYYLETFGGSFTENFYGLKRERILSGVKDGETRRAALGVPGEVRERVKLAPSSSSNSSSRRGTKDIWLNLLVMVGIPYAKRKLDESYDIHIAPTAGLLQSSSAEGDGVGLGGVEGRRFLNRDELPPGATVKQRILWLYKWFLRNIYPSLNAAYYFSILAFSLSYLFDGTKYSSPFLWMIGTRIRRMGEADYRAIEAAGQLTGTAAGLATAVSGVTATGRSARGQGLASFFHPRNMYPRLLGSLKLLLPTSIFALKFLEWWYASDFSRQLSRKAAEGLELPPPIVSGLGFVKRQHERKEQVKTEKEKGLRSERTHQNTELKRDPPISSITYLPILTVPPPTSSDLCPICLHPIETAAACQTGYVYDFKCIFQWIEGMHERQETWMRGEKMSEWEDDDDERGSGDESGNNKDEPRTGGSGSDNGKDPRPMSREGKWESGKGRCAVTGRRVLGGTSGIRRIMV